MSLKTERKIKEQAQKLASEMGFSLGTLINAFLRQFVKDRSLNFTADPKLELSPEMKSVLHEVELDIREGKNVSPQFSDPQAALAYLKKSA